MAIIQNPILKTFVFCLGIFCVLLGVVGAFLPLIPTTPFILLAAWCFLRSSPRAYHWIQQQPVFGPALKEWENHRTIARPAKILALSMMALSLTFIWIKISSLTLKIGITFLFICIALYIATRNERHS